VTICASVTDSTAGSWQLVVGWQRRAAAGDSTTDFNSRGTATEMKLNESKRPKGPKYMTNSGLGDGPRRMINGGLHYLRVARPQTHHVSDGGDTSNYNQSWWSVGKAANLTQANRKANQS
jgi:hypothetical protein